MSRQEKKAASRRSLEMRAMRLARLSSRAAKREVARMLRQEPQRAIFWRKAERMAKEMRRSCLISC